jgi:hypothetical protein
MGWLSDNAPRLARAHDEFSRLYDAEYRERLQLIDSIQRLEALVAHRDLEFLRAGARRHKSPKDAARHLSRRQAKLDSASSALKRHNKRLKELDAWRR